jgi:hypothetical protein
VQSLGKCDKGCFCVLDVHAAVRSVRARRALQQYYQAGVPLHNVTVSSDAFGSLPTYDSAGRLVKYSVADARALLRFLRSMYFQVGLNRLVWLPA